MLDSFAICFKAPKSQFVEHSPYILQLYRLAHPAITCSKLKIETLEQGVKYAHI